MEILDIFRYQFFINAFISGVFLSIVTAILGCILILRRMAMISDGLSHVTFATVSFALILGFSPIFISIPIVIIASFVINKLSEKTNFYSDSAIGLISSISIAIGTFMISLTSGFNVDINSYLFGSILAVSYLDLILVIIMAIIVVIVIVLSYNEIFLLIYDEDYAKISGISTKSINLLFSVVQSVVIVLGVKIVGAFLMSSLIIFPAITSLNFAKNFKKMIIFSIFISISSMVIGLFLSFLLNSPTGSTIVLVNGVIFLLVYLISKH